MSAGMMAEYVAGILVPLGMFWAGERGWLRWAGMEKSTPDSTCESSPESGAKKGALPPLRSPSSGLGTARILSEWSQIQRACRLEGGSPVFSGRF